jgi:two-component system cell cycle sensor histidine kinase/response regulator CckA
MLICWCALPGLWVNLHAQPPPVSDSARFERPLVVPISANNYPILFVGPDGERTGFAMDLLNAIARVMDFKIQWKDLSGANFQSILLSGQGDILAGYTRTPEREKHMDFSVPYLEFQGALFVRKDKNLIQKISDLNGRELVIVSKGSVGDQFVSDKHLNAHVVYEHTVLQAIKELNNGQHDAVFSSRLTVLSLIDYFKLSNVRPLGVPVDGYPIVLCFAVRKGDSQLLARLNEGLAIMQRTGEFDQIYKKWFSQVEPEKFSYLQFVSYVPYVAATLAVVLLITFWALLRQRQLRRRIGRQAEELIESKSILAEAQQFARIGHWQRPLDPNAPLVWSEETYHIYERDPRLPPPSISEVIDCAIGEDRQRWLDLVQRSQKESFDYALDVHIEPKPGVKKIIHVHGRPVRNARGQPTGFFGTVQDVTEWREAERGQRESIQLLRAIYDNAPFAMGVFELTDRAITVVSVNPEARRLVGLPAQITPGRSFAELGMPPEQVIFWTELFTRHPTNNAPFKTTLRLSATHRDLAVTLVPLGRASKRPRFCLIAEDITDRVHKDAEIAQSRRLRAVGELVGGIAHEFNNLLTPILLKADALQHEYRQTELAAELQTIIDAAIRAAEITRRLLTFQRKADRKPEKIRLRAAIESDIELLRHAIDRRIRLECTIASDLPTLWLPGTDLHQIIVNLLLNARDTLIEKLTHDPADSKWIPSIQIEAKALPADAAVPLDPSRIQSPPAGWVRLTLRDNGLGMPPDVLERIFEPFYTTKPVGQGTGLGLATVWHLVTELGGSIDVNSVPGAGTAFNLCLPIRASTEAAPSSAKTAAVSAAIPSTARILLVDDEDAVSNLVCEILRYHGHQVTMLANGRLAWEKLSAAPGTFDLIIMDLNMPGLNGLELARRTRELPFAGIIFVMSGRLSESDRAEFQRLRVDRIIEKPFTLDTFVTALAAFGLARPARTETAVEAAPVS